MKRERLSWRNPNPLSGASESSKQVLLTRPPRSALAASLYSAGGLARQAGG